MTIIIIKIAFSIIAGILGGPAAVYVFNHIPGQWLCDYGETPVERGNALAMARGLTAEETENITRSLVDPNFRRIKENPWRWVFAAAIACLCVKLSMQSGYALPIGDSQVLALQVALAGLLLCWTLLIIGLADGIYMIIPDQFLLILMIAGSGMLPVHMALIKSPVGDVLREMTDYRFSDGVLAAVYVVTGIMIGVLLMLLVALLGRAVSGCAALGMGDIKLYAALGFALGGAGIIFVFLLSSLTAGLHAGISMAGRRTGRKDRKPLGPHICLAAVIYVFIFL